MSSLISDTPLDKRSIYMPCKKLCTPDILDSMSPPQPQDAVDDSTHRESLSRTEARWAGMKFVVVTIEIASQEEDKPRLFDGYAVDRFLGGMFSCTSS